MAVIENIKTALARRLSYLKIRAELARLSDDELRDLDLSYARIDDIAWQAARAA